eukprot:CAMPEP_0181326474 /NCGR_PEP_ID=MMETSP1101-20121128/21516_1 /TAXON_ID=46948 /ORGANISM="Rhodomonas abbreviata, Strain Caron Lab Isolate" /LENGTH=107 /DNA_ID=CAMNT_0023434927 /DNA_START=32 /DNA_END=351 /DNA_ORIENTATION=+
MTFGSIKLVAASAVVSALCIVVILVSQEGDSSPSELYYRPESQVYRAAGHYSPKTGRYPVDQEALREYLKHQPPSTLRTLSARRVMPPMSNNASPGAAGDTPGGQGG